MLTANFPTWAECLDEFAAGLRESKQTTARSAIQVSPYLRQPAQCYANFMAGRETGDKSNLTA